MNVISLRQLLESGVHFGHKTKRWNPKMAPYIFCKKNGIHIIDLQKTSNLIDTVCDVVANCVAMGGNILFVGTKKQAATVIKEEATRCNMFYVSERWLGGMLTNFKTICSRIDKLKNLNKMAVDGTFDLMHKKEVAIIKKEMENLEKVFCGVKKMTKLPDMVFVVDPKKEHLCIKEAKKLKIPIIGIVDTNCNPDDFDYIIPANDDSTKSIKCIVNAISEAIIIVQEGINKDVEINE